MQDTAQAVSGSYKLTIPSSNRTVNSTSTRDGLPLSYTAYKTDANGDIDFTQTTLELEKGDSAGSLGITYPLIFLEGMLQQHSGNFSQVPTAQTVYVPFPSIIEGAVSVSSTDGIWSEIDSLFFASGADHKVFEKRYRDDYSVDLYFGDGIRSATPTVGTSNDPSFSGEGNISCTLSNPTAGTGGFNAESPDLAKRYGPQWFASQYRCVTGEDYTSFANRYITDQGQTGKALSVLRDNGGAGNMIDIYLLTRASNNQLERSNYPFKSGLLEYLNKYRMLTDELTIVDGLVRTLDLVCTVYIDRDRKLNSQDIQARVSARIQKFFDISNMDFGTPVKFSDLTNYVLEDNAVRFFKVENYASDIFNNFNEIAQLNNFELNVQTV